MNNYAPTNSQTETLHTVKPRRVCCDINQAAKINGKISLSLAHENHGYKLADNPPIFAFDGKNYRLKKPLNGLKSGREQKALYDKANVIAQQLFDSRFDRG